MTDAASAKASSSKSNLNPRVEHAFFSVEGEIRDVSHMASIACSLINDVRDRRRNCGHDRAQDKPGGVRANPVRRRPDEYAG
jgi:hypothetical protein